MQIHDIAQTDSHVRQCDKICLGGDPLGQVLCDMVHGAQRTLLVRCALGLEHRSLCLNKEALRFSAGKSAEEPVKGVGFVIVQVW